jgi:hypothetical protein
MKKLFVILLSLLLFFNSSLFVIFYQVRLIELSLDIQEKVQNLDPEALSTEIVLIKLSEKDLNTNPDVKVISEDEFSYNGYMYDVAFRKTSGDTVYLFCINDVKEDELLGNLITHFENTETKNEKMNYFNILFSFLSNAMIPGLAVNAPGFPQSLPIKQTSSNTSRGIHRVVSPPPKLLV